MLLEHHISTRRKGRRVGVMSHQGSVNSQRVLDGQTENDLTLNCRMNLVLVETPDLLHGSHEDRKVFIWTYCVDLMRIETLLL